jgi:ABC-type transporter Mla MlaB component
MAGSAPQTVVFSIDGPIARTDLSRLCEEVDALLERTGAEVALCDVSAVEPDVVCVDALARLQLAARRRGCQARLRGASNELLELLDFIGMRDVLRIDLGLEPQRQAEERENPRGVEEEGELDDAAPGDLEHL